jgi:hypothetical protein
VASHKKWEAAAIVEWERGRHDYRRRSDETRAEEEIQREKATLVVIIICFLTTDAVQPHLSWCTIGLIYHVEAIRSAMSCRLVLVVLMTRTSPCPPPWPDRAPSAEHRSHPRSTGGGRSCPTWSFLLSQTQLRCVSQCHVQYS